MRGLGVRQSQGNLWFLTGVGGGGRLGGDRMLSRLAGASCVQDTEREVVRSQCAA